MEQQKPDSLESKIPAIFEWVALIVALWYGAGAIYAPLGSIAHILSPYVVTTNAVGNALPNGLGGLVDSAYAFIDYALVIGLLIFVFVQLHRDYEKPSKAKAFIYLAAFLLVGFLWAYTIPYLNLLLPFYSGGLPQFTQIVTSGIMPYLLMISLGLGIVFNVRQP